MYNENLPAQAHSLTDQAAESAQTAIKATQRATNAALNGIAGTSEQFLASAHRASDKTAQYIRDEPVKAVLIAAAAGAAVATVISLLTRSHH